MSQIITFFKTHRMSAEHYDRVTAGLSGVDGEDSTQGPPGRLSHVCYGHPEKMEVIDVWESKAHFDRFYEELGTTLEDAGVVLDRIEIYDAYNVRIETPPKG